MLHLAHVLLLLLLLLVAADSLVSRFNLVCSDSWKAQFANSLMFMGCFIGALAAVRTCPFLLCLSWSVLDGIRARSSSCLLGAS
jgi:hypothetical protein